MKSKIFKINEISLSIVFLILSSCGHGPVKSKKEALIKISTRQQSYTDQLEFKTLKEALVNTIEKLEISATNKVIEYPVTFSMKDYLAMLKMINRCSNSIKQFQQYLKQSFDPYIVFGKDDYGEILLTSYYEPLLKASNKKTKIHNTPLYRAPRNIVEVKLSKFDQQRYGNIQSSRKIISAQMTKDKFGNKQIVPLPSRYEIDYKGALTNQGLEIAYVDPIEAFFLHIQGSGRVIFKDGRTYTLGYHAQNGMKYEPIGKFLKEHIPSEKMSLQSIEKVLRTKYKENLQDILPLNPSYIFFKKIKGRARTTLGTEVTDRRTLAVDASLFKLGLIGHLNYPELEITNDGAVEKEPRREHFVFNQDTGGAIKGTGRADLFWGSGEEGKRIAGHMRHKAKLTFFLPKPDSIQNIRNNQIMSCR